MECNTFNKLSAFVIGKCILQHQLYNNIDDENNMYRTLCNLY